MTDKPTITCTGRCNGMGDRDDTGSYVRLIYRVPGIAEHYIKISEGAAETLISELRGALGQKKPHLKWQFQVDGRAGPSPLRDTWAEAARDCVAAGYGHFSKDGCLLHDPDAAIFQVPIP